MRNTLPLSSFPLQLLLAFEQHYQLLLALCAFLLVLFKTYNLPYSGAMSAQEGVILLLFVPFIQVRIKYGIGANRLPQPLCRRRAPTRWPCSYC